MIGNFGLFNTCGAGFPMLGGGSVKVTQTTTTGGRYGRTEVTKYTVNNGCSGFAGFLTGLCSGWGLSWGLGARNQASTGLWGMNNAYSMGNYNMNSYYPSTYSSNMYSSMGLNLSSSTSSTYLNNLKTLGTVGKWVVVDNYDGTFTARKGDGSKTISGNYATVRNGITSDTSTASA
jgi:hypothetical protein